MIKPPNPRPLRMQPPANENRAPFPSPFLLALLFVALLTGLRIHYLFISPYDLYADEAQYWNWSETLSLGYYSKPPIVAWAIAATTSFCGEAEWCVRLSSPLTWAATSMAIYSLGRLLFAPIIGMFAAIAFITLPSITLSASLISTDPFLVLFWTLTLISFLKAITSGRWRWWITAGICAGLGMLSKYTFLIFLPSAFLFLATTPSFRRWLKSPKFYVCIAITLLIFAPNIYWNAENHFVSFFHTRDNAALGGPLFNPEEFGEFIGAQFAVFGPIMFGTLLFLFATVKKRWRDTDYKFLLSFILPLFCLIAFVSLLSRAHANWAAPIYVPATLFVVHYLWENGRTLLLHSSILLHIVIAGIFYNYHDLAHFFDIDLNRKHDPFVRVQGWEELGNAVSNLQQRYPETTLLTDTRKTTATLLYYIHPRPFPFVKWNEDGAIDDHYELNTSMDDMKGKNFLLITKDKTPDNILKSFLRYKKLSPIVIPVTHDFTRTYDVYYLTRFLGYTPDPEDIKRQREQERMEMKEQEEESRITLPYDSPKDLSAIQNTPSTTSH